MPGKELMDKISIYVPKSKAGLSPVQRLIQVGEERDRSVNYIVMEAILQYLEREESQNRGLRVSRE